MLSASGALGVAVASLAVALSIWPSVAAVDRARLSRLTTPSAAVAVGRPYGGRLRSLFFAGLAGLAVAASFPSVVGALAGVVTASGAYLLLSASTDGSRSRIRQAVVAVRAGDGRFARTADADPRLPFAIDVLAVCLRAGMPTPTAMRSVAYAIWPESDSGSVGVGGGGAAGTGAAGGSGGGARRAGEAAVRRPRVSLVFGHVAAALELGSEPAAAWAEWIGDPTYGPLGRALLVTGESGSSVAGRLDSVSKRLRTEAAQAALARSQRVGVALMAPLGLCFLPAFVCLGVVPVIVGIAGQVFG